MAREQSDNLSTADLVAGTEHRHMEPEHMSRGMEQRPPTDLHEDPFAPRSEHPQNAEPMPREPGPGQHMQPMDPGLGERMHEPMPDAMDDSMAPSMDDRTRIAQEANAQMENLAALFPADVAADFRHRWDTVQIGFVDDPRHAVQQADELVAHVMKSLAESFARQRSQLEAGLGQDGQGDTEHLRMALRSYRSFFQRLLSL